MGSETKKSRTSRRFRVIAGSTAAVLVGSGVAIAFWTTTGTGTGSATAGALENITIAQDGAITGLFPVAGTPAQDDPGVFDVRVTVTNPAGSTSAATIESIATTVAAVTPGEVPGDEDGECPVSEFVVTPVAFAPFTVAPGATSAPVTVATIHLTDTGVNQNACQNATVDLAFASPAP